MKRTTYTVYYPFGHSAETTSTELAGRASNLGLKVTARTGYGRVG